MKLTFTKSQFEMPDGKYVARFDGVTMKDATGKLDQHGKPMPPGMTWDFVILEGEHAGKKADRLTGRQPTAKSGCGKILAGISDTVLRDGMEIDLQQFYGKVYRITVEDNKVSDSPAPVRVYEGTGTAAAAPSRPSGPPPRPGAKPAPAPTPPEPRFYVAMSADAEPVEMTASDMRDLLAKPGTDLDAVQVCRVQDGAEWTPASKEPLATMPF